jgi:hypothetical protein
MPREKSGVHNMRVQHGDVVHILACRLPFVAWRGHRWNEAKRAELLKHLRAQERLDFTYRVTKCWHTGVTGLLTAHDAAGATYSVHHTDVVRV